MHTISNLVPAGRLFGGALQRATPSAPGGTGPASGPHGGLVDVERGPHLVGHPLADLPPGQQTAELGPLGGDDQLAQLALRPAGGRRSASDRPRLPAVLLGDRPDRDAPPAGGRCGPAGTRSPMRIRSTTSSGNWSAPVRSSMRPRAITVSRRRASATSTASCSSRVTRPSRRMSGGRVRPWPTSVATMTAKVRNTSRSRWGKSWGRASDGGQAHRAAHAGPADHGGLPPRRRRALGGPEEPLPSGQGGGPEHPRHAAPR